jgi:hypothetical protein
MPRGLGSCFFVATLLAGWLAVPADARTLHVTANGVDGADCGAKAAPCHTITQGIANAAAGDRIVVGPGRYHGESGAAGCSCFVAVDKALSITSSDGAAATIVDARSSLVIRAVAITANGVEFGRPGKGFTVTNPGGASGTGIEVDSNDVAIRGNQLIADHDAATPGDAIRADSANAGPIVIDGNQVMLWEKGIVAVGSNRTVSRNQVSLSSSNGMVIEGSATATGNVVTGNDVGVFLADAPEVSGNAVYGSTKPGFEIGSPFSGTIEQNDIVGNADIDNCSLANDGVAVLVARNNYWGAPTGPGPNPANDVCNHLGGTTSTAPFAKAPFTVRAIVKP